MMVYQCLGGCGRELVRRWGRGAQDRYCPACRKTARADVIRRHKDKRKAEGFRAPLWYQHGLSNEDYADMLAGQGGRCAGCHRAPPVAGKDLHVDHDHRVGCHPTGGRSCPTCRRGLLCAECNMALGLLHDRIEVLHRLADYLEKYQ